MYIAFMQFVIDENELEWGSCVWWKTILEIKKIKELKMF